ncbi:MAG: hypothetical protein A49_21970 [Methyloceanibacter sp.]|nr:MAG: hypothetical protein A49_21970 [Methyloceanibacter sp.]
MHRAHILRNAVTLDANPGKDNDLAKVFAGLHILSDGVMLGRTEFQYGRHLWPPWLASRDAQTKPTHNAPFLN